ncbi:MAG: helix-turn-helix domain-containing protein [Bifidobacteriaceae bacterium]|jgi:excisionase family DNA binding protein|nr:helix-turn-helix domain-containing protein [Bifidobacteriaceae bacterium]
MAMTLDPNPARLALAAAPEEQEQAKRIGAEARALLVEGPSGPEPLPAELSGLLARVVASIASGTAVTIEPMPEELTTSEAARQLGVTRPTLVRMIRSGQIDARLVGTHHRVKTSDVAEQRRQRLAKQLKAFEELRELDDQLGHLQ